MAAKRPDMRDYFRSRIEWHVHGLASFGGSVRLPGDVRRVEGDVTDHSITVFMNDGTEFHWLGGRYSVRKRHGCYAPLMPKAV